MHLEAMEVYVLTECLSIKS